MQHTRRFEPLGKPLCPLVMGTSFWRPLEQSEADTLFDAYANAGGNCFDTALVYHDVERSLGAWMKSRGNREQIVVHAKCAHHETVQPEGSHFEYHRARVTPRDIQADLDETLRRLQTDYVDILTLHRDDPDQPVGPILECLAKARHAGRVRAFGASNWTIPRLEEARDCAQARGLPGFALSSPSLSLAFANEPSWPNCVSACDHFSRQWYEREQLPVFAWSSLALGFFNGRYRPIGETSAEEFARLMSDRWTSDVVRVYYSDRNFERLARASQLATAKGVSATQIALAWVLHLPFKPFAVVGPRTPDQIRQLFEAAEIRLTDSEAAWLDLRS